MDPAELEGVAHRALRALPAPRAPETLAGRVMAALALQARRPWYQRAWRTWPLAGRVAAAAAIVLVMAAAVAVMPAAVGLTQSVAASLGVPSIALPAAIEVPLRSLGALAGATVTVWRVVVSPVAPYVAAFVVLMGLACVAFGTALDRVVALGGATES